MTEYKGVASGILDGGELEVRCFPDPVLKKPAEPVEEFDEELADFVARMRVAMQTHDGVGLGEAAFVLAIGVALPVYG